jgi:hypothetical protein
MAKVAEGSSAQAPTLKAEALEAARRCVAAAVVDAQQAARKAARQEVEALEVKGRPKPQRLTGELSARDALRVVVANAHLGLGARPVNDALRVFSDYWTGGGNDGQALRLPSAIVLAKWIAGEQVMPLETAAQYIRRSTEVESARQAVVERLRQAQQRGASLDVAMRAMLSAAIQGADPASLELAGLLRRARDPRGGSRGGPWAGLPSEKSIWRWIGVANLAAGDLKPKRGGRKFPVPPWAADLAEVEAANPGASVNLLHHALCKRLQAVAGAVNPSPWAVRRWIEKRRLLACAG